MSISNIIRIVIGLVFFALGLSHFYYTHEMAIYVPLPTGSSYFVYIVGAGFTFASLALMANKSVKTSLVAIALLLAISAGFVQLGIESRNTDEILKSISITNIVKLLVACGVLVGAVYTKGK